MTQTQPQALQAPLYALGRDIEGAYARIGGPFEDVDDLLDCCFDHMMQHDLPNSAVAFIEKMDGVEHRRAFPRGALPEND